MYAFLGKHSEWGENRQGGETGVILLLIDRAVCGERNERAREKRERETERETREERERQKVLVAVAGGSQRLDVG